MTPPRPRLPASRWLMPELIVRVSVEMAATVGLNKAIVLQQVHYWLERSAHVHEGRRWVYNTYEDWQRQFPWWSVPTVKRIFLELEADGLLLVGRFNQIKMDRTKWYSIDFDRLLALEEASDEIDRATDQIDPIRNGSHRSTDGISLTRAIPETTSETPREEPVTLEERMRAAVDPRAVRPRPPAG